LFSSSEEDLTTILHRNIRTTRISSSSEDDDNNYEVSSHDHVTTSDDHMIKSQDSNIDEDHSSVVVIATDPDTSSSCSDASQLVADSNDDIASQSISGRLRHSSGNPPMINNDIITDSGCFTPLNSIHSGDSHGNNIKRRLRAHSSTHRLHSLITTSSNTAVTCILSRDDDDDDRLVSSHHSSPEVSSSVKHKTPTMRRAKRSARSRGVKRHRKSRGTSKRKRVKRIRNLNDESFVPSGSHSTSSGVAMEKRRTHKKITNVKSTPPINVAKRARTAATSPRVIPPDTPQLRMRQLVRARCQTGTLEEARKISEIKRYHRLTQNDVIARQVQERSQQPVWWDNKMIECHKSKTRMVCTNTIPLENTAKRQPSTITVKQYVCIVYVLCVVYVMCVVCGSFYVKEL